MMLVVAARLPWLTWRPVVASCSVIEGTGRPVRLRALEAESLGIGRRRDPCTPTMPTTVEPGSQSGSLAVPPAHAAIFASYLT
jgi:hypothetical protein